MGMFLVIWTNAIQAAPTPVNTIISNTVTLNYDVSGVPGSVNSNTAQFVVAEKIDLTLTNNPPVSVNSPDVDRVQTFILTNIGNGQESFSLARNNAVTGDQFDPADGTSGTIYLDTNDNNILEIGTDLAYSPAGITLNASESRRIFVLSDIPPSRAIGDIGLVGLTASSMTPGAAGQPAGTVITNGGDGGAIDAVVGTSQAQQTQAGAYIVSGVTVAIAKTVCVQNGASCDAVSNNVSTGSTLVYTITVTLSGTGTANNLKVDDPLPTELTFEPGSILIASPDSDDTAQFLSNTVTVTFGNTVAPATRSFTFKATVN
jgi:uncharacterized repeat protein (TIGR01451 family)